MLLNRLRGQFFFIANINVKICFTDNIAFANFGCSQFSSFNSVPDSLHFAFAAIGRFFTCKGIFHFYPLKKPAIAGVKFMYEIFKIVLTRLIAHIRFQEKNSVQQYCVLHFRQPPDHLNGDHVHNSINAVVSSSDSLDCSHMDE